MGAVPALHEWLPTEAPWQTLQAGQVGEPLGPRAAPVAGGVGFSAAGRVALGAVRFFVRVGVAAGTALDPVQLGAGEEVGAVVAAGKMAGDLEVNDRMSISFLSVRVGRLFPVPQRCDPACTAAVALVWYAAAQPIMKRK